MKQLSKYQTLLRELIKLTREGELHWHQVDRHSNAEVILNANSVMRQYKCTWVREGRPYMLALVEKKRTVIEHPLIGPEEEETAELLILEHGELLDTLDTSNLHWIELRWLAATVRHHCGKSAEFFAMA